MMFWVLLFGLFLAALMIILVPLFRYRDSKAQDRKAQSPNQGKNIEVYKAQLRELEADHRNGLLGEAEAAAARLEIERRLLKLADEQEATESTGASRVLLVTATTVMFLLSTGFYLTVGMPGMPDFALKDQAHSAAQQADKDDQSREMTRKMMDKVAKLEAQLQQDPTDAKAWHTLGLYQSQLQNRAAAAQAFQRWYELEPDSIDAAVVYGESLIMLSDGRVGPAALLVLNKARKMQPLNPGVRHYLALAAYQAGNVEQALAGWQQLAADSKPDAPWLGQLRRWIRRAERDLGVESADNDSSMPALSEDQRKAITEMSSEEQTAMIKGMVGRLQDKMNQNPENIQGWFRLAKAYLVLGQKPDAIKSLEKAEKYAADDLKSQIKKQLEILRK